MKRLLLKDLDKQEFTEYYLNHTHQETAEHFSICQNSVYNMQRLFGLPKKGHKSKINDFDTFKKYATEHGMIETANYFNVASSVVCKWARRLEVPRKYNRYKDVNVEINDTQKDILFGSLLGDGSLTKVKNNGMSRFRELHCLKQEDYAHWKYVSLLPFSQKFTYCINNKKHLACKFHTLANPFFSQLEKEWYERDQEDKYVLKNNGHRIKIVPKSLVLTPMSLAVWYLDDGYRPKRDRQHYICSFSFSIDDCSFLVEQIKRMGMSNCWVRRKHYCGADYPEIAIGASSSLDFLDLLSSNIGVDVDSLQYKLTKREIYNNRINEVA